MATSTKFVNILTDLRKVNDLAYVFQSRNFTAHKNCRFRNVKRMKLDVLSSQRVVDAVNELVKTTTRSKCEVETEAAKMCDEMFLNFDMKAVRVLAYLAKKVFPRLFSAIYVGSVETIFEIRRLCANDPVLFVPSHRSYMDFILLQFVCLHFEISLPAIASAIDFMKMILFGELLRRSGAYFIRRSFKENALYLAIFTEYVQNLVLDGERPTEVFVEGTRSRTGKSLHPKHGFLSTILELFLSNRIFDILVVPVNLSYNKTLEEVLYAYELLGFTKPPESTSALLKARTILDTNYGDAYVTFCEPISVRDYFDTAPGVDRSIRRIAPPFVFTDAEKRAIVSFSHKLIKTQESKAVLNLWMLVCLEINSMLAHEYSSEQPSINYDHLRSNIDRWFDIFSRLGFRIPLRTGSISDELTYYINLHQNLVRLSECGRLLTLPDAPPPAGRAADLAVDGVRQMIGVAVPRLILSNFANQCLHALVDACFVSINFEAAMNLNEFSLHQVRDEFGFLKVFYGREFVYEQTTNMNNLYDLAIKSCVEAGLFETTPDHIIKTSRNTDVAALKCIFEPWLISYRFCVEFMINLESGSDERSFVRQTQELISKRLDAASDGNKISGRVPKWHQMLSSDTLKNALHAMVDIGAVRKVHKSSGIIYVGEYVRLVDVKRRLDKFLHNCHLGAEVVYTKCSNVKSKL